MRNDNNAASIVRADPEQKRLIDACTMTVWQHVKSLQRHGLPPAAISVALVYVGATLTANETTPREAADWLRAVAGEIEARGGAEGVVGHA